MSRDKPEARVKNQHLVPQFYLRHFCNEKGRLFAFDKPQQKIFCSSPSGVGSSLLFYDLPVYDLPASILKPGIDPQIVEKTLAIAESSYSDSLSAVLAHLDEHGTFPEAERVPIADFVAVQAFRTRDVRLMIQQMQQMTDIALKGENGGPYKTMTDFTSLPFIHAMLIFQGGAPEARSMLLNHIWLVARNATSNPLYTSDCPVIKNPHIKHELVGHGGLGSPGIEVCLPLSPKYLLVMLERTFHAESAPKHLQCIDLLPENIEFYNGHQVLASDRQLYSVSDNFEVARNVIAARPDVRDPERQRTRFIWGGRDIALEEQST